jgi:predicted RNA-binding Zn-ribbon protein involved in translation (DUF1610 family)
VSITDRLRELERRIGGQCPECGATDGEDTEPVLQRLSPGEVPRPCPACGTMPTVIRMRPVRIGQEPVSPAGT